jgi:uncharacterized membrane protein
MDETMSNMPQNNENNMEPTPQEPEMKAPETPIEPMQSAAPEVTHEQTAAIPPTKKGNPDDVNDNKIFAIISYLWILCFVSLFAKSDSEFVKFHAKQGVVLFLAWVAVFIFSEILKIITLWRLGYIVMSIGNLAILVFAIMGIMHAVNGNMEKLPFIGQYANKLNL